MITAKALGLYALLAMGSYAMCQLSVLIVCILLFAATGWTCWTLSQHLQRETQ
jgi:hypothetical protein